MSHVCLRSQRMMVGTRDETTDCCHHLSRRRHHHSPGRSHRPSMQMAPLSLLVCVGRGLTGRSVVDGRRLGAGVREDIRSSG